MARKFLHLGAALALAAGTAFAGPITDFDAQYRDAYASYRAALFATNTGDAGKSRAAMDGFASKWAAFTATYGDTPPPHLAEDAGWQATLATVTGEAEAAAGQVAAGNLPAAHETLEGVRDALWGMHQRNGIETFSDRMNAYHLAMEGLLSIDPAAVDAAMMGDLREKAAVLSYLAQDLLSHPPAEAATDADYAGLAAAFEGSVAAILSAVRSGDPQAVRAALAGLKPPYAKFFLKFG